MMRQTAILVLIATVLAFPTLARADPFLMIDPANQTVGLGESVEIAVRIGGLGHYAPDSLGTYSMDLVFDPTLLAFGGISFGDPVFGDQLALLFPSIQLSIPSPASVTVMETSLDPAIMLDTLQEGEFTLATLWFTGISYGTSLVGVDPATLLLGDSIGVPLPVEALFGGSIQVSAIPEPATWPLVACGIAALIALRKRAPAPGGRKRDRPADSL